MPKTARCIVVQVDGQLKTGRDVIIAALLGAEEFGFATAPLVVAGCVMMRVCHLNTCPVGVATQDPELRKKFSGKPEFVENFFRFLAEEVRELMAELGFRTVDDMVGRSDRLDVTPAVDHWKAAGVDLSQVLHQPPVPAGALRRQVRSQDHGLDDVLDRTIIRLASAAIEHREPVTLHLPIRNANRATGTMLGYEITRRHGGEGLPDDTVRIHFTGSAGQSFGALYRAADLCLEGDANISGEGLSGDGLLMFAEASTFPGERTTSSSAKLRAVRRHEWRAYGVESTARLAVAQRAYAVVEGSAIHGANYDSRTRRVLGAPAGTRRRLSGGIAMS